MTGLFKNFFQAPFKHKKLSEDWAQLQSSVSEGVSFACRDLGSTMVTEAQNESATAEAIRRIIHLVRATHAKPKRVALHVSSAGVRVRSSETGAILKDTDIYEIAYCSADAHFNHVVAFIANGDKNVFECHAYLCQSSKIAQTVAVSIAHAFNMVYHLTFKADLEENISSNENNHQDSPEENILMELELELNRSTDRNGSEIVSSNLSPREMLSPKLPKYGTKDSGADVSLRELDPLDKKYEKFINFPPIRVPRNTRTTNKHTWAAFDEGTEKDFSETFSALRLNESPNVSCLYTKPPQRCKENAFEQPREFSDLMSVLTTDLKLPKIIHSHSEGNRAMDKNVSTSSSANEPFPYKVNETLLSKANQKFISKMDKKQTKTTALLDNTFSPTRSTMPKFSGMREFRSQPSVFDKFDDVWCQIGNSLESSSLGKVPPSDIPFSLEECQSPSPFGSRVSYHWTSFSD